MSESIRRIVKAHPVIEQFLRFACIGLLNTALNFLLFNAITKALGIDQGFGAGIVDFFSFSMAVIQSYLWNRTWTFGRELEVRLMTTLMRLIKVGALGAVAIILSLGGSRYSAPWYYYVIILAVYLVIETGLWRSFRFHLSDWNHESHSFIIFFIVTFIGLLINSGLTGFFTAHVHLTEIVDLNKNIGLVLATGISLFWNFTGYKVIVFKK